MNSLKPSNIVFTTALVLLTVGIGSVYVYSSAYHALVRIEFSVTVYAYPQGDYGYVTFHALKINFMGLNVWPSIGSNEPTPISYGKGQLNKSLSMGANVIWVVAANHAFFSSKNFSVTFARPGQYSVVLEYVPPDIPRNTYCINVTYANQFYQNAPPYWFSAIYYYTVE